MISNLSQVPPVSFFPTTEPVVPPAANVAAVSEATSSASSGPEATNISTAGGTDQQLAAAVEHLNNKVQDLNRNLEFSIDQDSGELVVKVVDAQTHEVIRQIPSQEALALAKDIERYLQNQHAGLVQTKA